MPLLTNQIQDEIKCRIKSGNSCYYSDLFVFSTIKNLKIKMYKAVIFQLYLFDCEIALKKENRLRVLGNRNLRRIFWPKRDENGEWRRLYIQETS